MARLKTYVVTSDITPKEIEEEVVARLKVTEDLNEGEDAFALTFDYNQKKLYMIFSDQMVAKDDKMTENMVEVNQDISHLNDEIKKITKTLSIIVNSDGGVIGKPAEGENEEADIDVNATLTAIQETLTTVNEKLLIMESKMNTYLKRSDVEALIKQEIAASQGQGGVVPPAENKDPQNPDPNPDPGAGNPDPGAGNPDPGAAGGSGAGGSGAGTSPTGPDASDQKTQDQDGSGSI